MKKTIIMFLALVMLISISACSSKTSNAMKLEEKPLLSTPNVEKPITNSYEELDKLPQKYNSELAQKNGDVVNAKGGNYNIEKLDKFIETYKNKKANVADMIRITNYTTEGDAIICDLIIDGKGIKLIEDNTRDNFSNTENRKQTEYKVLDIWKINKTEGIVYIAKTDKGGEKNLFFINNQKVEPTVKKIDEIREIAYLWLNENFKKTIINWKEAKVEECKYTTDHIVISQSGNSDDSVNLKGIDTYKITFSTTNEGILGPIIIYIDMNTFNALGGDLLRD